MLRKPTTAPCRAVALLCALCLVLLPVSVSPTWAQEAPQRPPQRRELIAVLDMEAVGATEPQAAAMTERLREEMLKTGRYILVDRSQMNAILDEQALQQTGCTDQECAVQVGQILGVRQIVAGKVTQAEEETWLLSAILVDVETAETLRAESIQYRGDYFSLLSTGIALLAYKIADVEPRAELQAAIEALPAGPGGVTAYGQVKEEDEGLPWWVWALIGVGIVGLAAAGGGGGGGDSGTATADSNPCPSGSGCGSVNVTW